MSVPNERNLRVYYPPYKARCFALHFIDNFWRHRLMRIFCVQSLQKSRSSFRCLVG